MNKFVVTSLLLLSACTQTVPLKDSHKTFVTKIMQDNSKTFIYSVALNKQALRQQSSAAHRTINDDKSGRDVRTGKGRQAKASTQHYKGQTNAFGVGLKELRQQLTVLFKQNSFCREGYIELDSFIDHRSAYIRGECNESATALDKAKFP